MSHTYLVYTREDSTFADVIEGELHDTDNKVWRDTSSIAEGADWSAEIEQGRAEAHAFLVLLSPSAVQSEWVLADIEHATRTATPMLVALIEECERPAALTNAPLVDFAKVRGAEGIEQLRLYRPAINELLTKLDQLQPVRVALGELSHPDDSVREAAARRLGELGDVAAGESLIESLEDADADVRFAAAEALGQLECRAAVRALVRRLDDDDPDVSAAAAIALGCVGDPDAVQPLIERLDHEDRFVRGDAAAALGKLGGEAAVPELVKLMRNDPISNVREAATKALCRIGGHNAERALRRSGVDCAEFDEN